ncbi:MAG: beta-class carbonic anhydrase, partial [Frankia sp.]
MPDAMDYMIARARAHPTRYGGRYLDARPATGVAIVTCMDARIDVFAIFGLHEGDAHVIRNAGGLVTEDVLRSLTVSQHALGTTEVIIVQHTGCGLLSVTEEAFAANVMATSGIRPPWPIGAFTDLDANVRDSVHTIQDSPLLRSTTAVRGFVFDVDSGEV